MHGTIDIQRIISDADSEFPALFQLFSGYLNQDWRDDYTSADAAVEAYKDEAPVAAVHDALVEIDRLLALDLDDAAMSQVLADGLGCMYQPQLDGVTPLTWVRQLRARLLPERSTPS